jgi:nucleotide-binding universal stress UspA family protein
MFKKILCANDGSEHATRALALAISIAKDHASELHMVSVEEIDYMPEFIEEVREETGLERIAMIPGFRRVIEYNYRRGGRNVHKQVVYVLAEANEAEVKISFEHQGFGWFSFDEAVTWASYDNSKRLLSEAEGFLTGNGRGKARLQN